LLRLRNLAKKVLPLTAASNDTKDSDVWKLVHELQIHQVELEMQNEELHRAQTELEASRGRLSDLYDFAPVGYLTLDNKGKILEANLTAARQLNKERSALIRESFYGHINNADRDVFYLHLDRVFRDRTRQSCEIRLKGERTGDFYVQLDSILVEDPKGNVACRSSVTDITRRRCAEEEKANLEEQLRHSQKMDAIGRLVGGIAHDFNNLMTVVNGLSDDILGRLTPDHLLREEIEWINNAGKRAAVLTRQLLAFGCKQTLHFQVVDLNRAIDHMERMLSRTIGEHLDLATDPSDDLERVKADLSQLELVIMNLVINAKDAMPRGGRLTIRTRNVTVDGPNSRAVPEAKPGRYVCLSVEDTGAGMDEATKESVFEPFFTTKSRSLGTGLGLSTVYGIVMQHGGWIEVMSQPGTGSTFEVYLPVTTEGEREGAGAEEPSDRVQGSGERILLVEDEEIIRKFCTKLLSANGYEVVDVKSAEDAIELFRQKEGMFDIVLSDIVLPGMNGYRLVDRLRDLSPTLRVLFISGYPYSQLDLPDIGKRSFGFIQKPFDIRSLLRALKEIPMPE
jgi:signal transduction histidine kinase